MHAVKRFTIGICKNSFGPCAFDFGPKTPVLINWVLGNITCNFAINGIDPPSPIYAAGLLKKHCEAFSFAAASQSLNSGAFQPKPASSDLKLIFASKGGFSKRIFSKVFCAVSPFKLGGIRIDSFTAIFGKVTLPAFSILGKPSAPVMDNCARQVRFSNNSTGSLETEWVFAA